LTLCSWCTCCEE